MQYINQYSKGFRQVTHRGKILVSSLNSYDYDLFLRSLQFQKYKLVTVPPGYEHRPDLLSNFFLGNPQYDWYICLINNIKDPFNELNINDKIIIPDM